MSSLAELASTSDKLLDLLDELTIRTASKLRFEVAGQSFETLDRANFEAEKLARQEGQALLIDLATGNNRHYFTEQGKPGVYSCWEWKNRTAAR